MVMVNFFTVIYIILAIACYMLFVQDSRLTVEGRRENSQVKINWFAVAVLLCIAFLFRYILAKIDSGYGVDMGCFQGWSDAAYNNGLGKFYNNPDMFSDYPPGYMYILWVIGMLRHFFTWIANSLSVYDATIAADVPNQFYYGLATSTVLVKMPAIIADLVTTALIYFLARKRFNDLGAITLSAIYSFNPVILIDSSMWGQVDSVFTMFVVIMVWLVAEKKLIPAYFVFAIGILIKPQTLILTPVLGFGILDQVFFRDFSWKKFFKHLGLGFLAILMMYVLVLPFHFDEYWVTYSADMVAKIASGEKTGNFLPVSAGIASASTNIFVRGVQAFLGAVALYHGTLTSYPYATVNAYNFWGMFGLNWHSQTEEAFGLAYSTWGTIFIIAIVAFALVICLMNRKKSNGSKYFFLGALITIGFFFFSVRVHERYMFPAFVLMLGAYLYRPRKDYLFAFLAFTIAQVNNIWDAFKNYDPNNFDWEASFPKAIGFIHLLCVAYFVFLAVRYYIWSSDEKEEVEEQKIQREVRLWGNGSKQYKAKAPFVAYESEPSRKFTSFDWIAVVAITVIYGAIALFNLGDMDAPQSYWETETQGDAITLDFSNQASPTRIAYYDGRYENREIYVTESWDGVNWSNVSVDGKDVTTDAEANKFTMSSVFCWGDNSLAITAPYVRFTCNSNETVINEWVFFDANGQKVVPNNSADYANLFDESDLYPDISTFRDSTYFDEIYHGRTGYEMVYNYYNYEWTHPPLGKFIISLGIRAFGMCPFGWRLPGTLFGIAMLPFFYLFSRRILKETWMATVTTILFAADFMHFTQTRIATIDVFVTFFIICMYYFMYQYTKMSFYDTKLIKTFIPLLCSGIAMGLGCASKWTGVYAGLGLGVIFFITMIRRYIEYRHAWMDPKGSSGNIKNETIVREFKNKILSTLGFCLLAFVAIPGTIFTLSYIPFNNGRDEGLIARMIRNQKDMWDYHSNLDATHPFQSNWYEWIIIKRPIWYYTKSVADGLQENISAFGNPLVWWAGIPAFFFIVYLVIAKKDKTALFLGLSYMAQLLPWVGVSRCTFIYHYFPSVPFIALMVGYSMYQICSMSKKSGASNYKVAKGICIAYAALAVVVFAIYYPVLSGYPISVDYGLKLRLFSSWVLVSG